MNLGGSMTFIEANTGPYGSNGLESAQGFLCFLFNSSKGLKVPNFFPADTT